MKSSLTVSEPTLGGNNTNTMTMKTMQKKKVSLFMKKRRLCLVMICLLLLLLFTVLIIKLSSNRDEHDRLVVNSNNYGVLKYRTNKNYNDDDSDENDDEEEEEERRKSSKQQQIRQKNSDSNSDSNGDGFFSEITKSNNYNNNKKFLNNFNGAVAMHRATCKEGSQIQTPWIGKDGKKVTLGSCTKKARQVLPEQDPLAFQRFSTCAVVGSGGIMVHKSVQADNLGDAIDKHEAVFRFNLAPTKGFEKSVGSKTTFRLINRKHFGFREYANETSLQHTTTPDVMKQFWDYKSLHPDLPTYPIDGSFYKYVMSDKDVANSRPSNGYLGLNLALMICDKINVYGFARNWKQRNMRYHYFNKEEPNESQMLRDGKGEMPLLEHLVKKNKNRVKMIHT